MTKINEMRDNGPTMKQGFVWLALLFLTPLSFIIHPAFVIIWMVYATVLALIVIPWFYKSGWWPFEQKETGV